MKLKRFIVGAFFALALTFGAGSLTACELEGTMSYLLDFQADGQRVHAFYTAGNAQLKLPEPPTKAGYTFDGWYLDEGTWQQPFNADSLANAPLTQDTVIHAKWKPTEYSAIFVADGKTIDELPYIMGDETLTGVPTVPQKAGYTGKWEDYALSAGGVTVNAVYTPIEYTVTFLHNGEVLGTDTYNIEDKTLNYPAVPEKEHYLGGWQDFNLTIGDIALRSVYTPIEYTVTFVANGKAVDTRTYNVEDTWFINPHVPNKTGYTGKWEPFTVTHGDMTVNAVYTLIPYTVTFVANGQTVATKTYDVEHTTVETPAIPDKEHYTGKWNDFKLTHGNVTVNATYTPVPYTVTFVANGQTVTTETYTVENTAVQTPELPNREHYTGKWNDFTLTHGNVTVNATYTAIVYTVTFVANGETVGSDTYTVEDKTFDSPTVPTKDHYDGAWESVKPTGGNLTVNAVYTATKYTVTFVAKGKTVGTKTYTVENTIVQNPEVPNELGYDGKWNDFTLTHGNVTVNAVYTAIEYKITFVANGQPVGYDTYTVEDKTVTSPTVPDKEHYTGAWETPELTTGDITVNAKYTAIEYKVTFVVGDQTVGFDTYTVEDTTVQNPEVPNKVGYTGEWENFTLTHGNVTIKAVYTTITYTITFVANNATVGTATYTVENKNYTAPSVPVLQCRLGSWEAVELTFGDITVAAVYTWSHTYTVTTIAPTCTVAGLETSVCSVCNDVQEAPISALGHSWFVTDEKAALCEADGFIHYGCKNGECQETKEDIVAATGHAWTMISEVKALCEKDGSQHFDCENCNKEKTEIVKAIGHVWKLVSSSVVTCMEDGVKDYGCQNCTHTKTEETLAGGHNFVSGKCSVCTLAEYGSASDYKYSSYGSGYRITGVNVQRKEMRVPASIGGRPVTRIYNSAFKDCTAEIIVIPDSVTEISSGAFNGCANLKQIVLPFIGQTNCENSERTRYPFGSIFGGSFTGGVATSQQYKTSGYTYTTTYYIPENLKKVTVTSGYVNSNDFMNCSTIKHVVYGEDSVFQAQSQPFNGMTALERVTLPENMTAYPTYFFGGLATETFAIPETITELPNYLFYNSSLKYITIPETVTEIGTNLFNGCSALESVTLPSHITRLPDYTFANCAGLTEIFLPESVTEIGDGAFSGCVGIVDLVVPDRVTYIGKSAFSYMQNLQSVTLPFIGSSEKTLDDAAYETFGYAFAYTGNSPANSSSYYTATHYKFDEQGAQSTYTSYFPKTLINITIKRGDVLPRSFIYCNSLQNVNLPETANYGFSAFYNCSDLKSVDIGVGATALDKQIFYNCAALETVTGGENVLSIGESVFYNCKKLTTVPAFENATAIGAFAFYGCALLQEVNIPDGVTAIGMETFYNCSSLTKADIPESVEKIGNYAFYNTRVETLEIPEKVTEIPYSLVKDNTVLKTVTMGDNVNLIRGNAFEGCTALQTVYLSAALTDIDYSVFKNCSSLQSIEIPNGVTKLYGSTFENCSALVTVILPENLTLIATTAFQGCTSIQATKTENGAAYLGSQSTPYALLLRPVDAVTNVTVNKATMTVNRDAFKDSAVTDIVIEEGFTTLHEYAFANATNLKTVVIPNTVTLVCAYAFQNCNQITELTLPDSVEQIVKGALADMLGLTKLTIPFVGETRKTENQTHQYPLGYLFGDEYRSSGVTQIRQYYHGNSTTSTTSSSYYFPKTLASVTVTGGEILYGAFYNCSNLTNVVIPNVEKIGDYAFYECSALVSIHIPSTVKTIGKNVFYNCSKFTEIVVPEGVEAIGANAFYSCDNLTDVTLPSTLKTVDSSAFLYCNNIVKVNIVSVTVFMHVTFGSSNEYLLKNAVLYVEETPVTEIAFPEGSQSVGNAFANYAGLEKLIIPDSVTEIADGAFSGCKNLTSVTLGNGLQSLGDNVFAGCSSLTSITLPDSVTTVGAAAFKGAGLKSIDLSNVSSLGANALQNCASLESVTLCPTLTELPAYVFGGCTSLMEIIIPSSVTVIGNYAFQNCTFTVIVIPDSVTSVGTQIFNGCNALESVTMPFIGKTATDTTSFGQHFASYTNDYPTALKNVTITAPTDTTVASGAFASIKGLENVYIDLRGGNVTFASGVMSNSSAILHIDLNDLADWFNLTFSSYTYNPIANGGILTVNGESLPEVWEIPANVTIDKYQFYGLTGIEKIVIPSGVTAIGEYAFSGAKVPEIVLPDTLETIGNYAFQNAQFKNFTIPNSVTSVSSTALDGCTALEYVYLGDGLAANMPAKLFADCTSLVEINLPVAGAKTTINSAYTDTYFIALFNESNSSSTVGTATWQDSYSNSRYTYYYRAQLPETLKKVTVRGGEISSFKTLRNLSLETLVLGENVTVSNDPLSQIGSVQNLTLPQAAFEGYKPTAVASIKSLTFNQYDGSEFVSNLSGLTSLETLNLPDCVTEFSPAYFSGAPYTLTVNFAENDRYVFDQGNIIDVTTNTVIVGFNATTLPEYVTAIGENAYVDRFGLTEVIIPATVETVDKTAFANCRITVLTAAADKLNAVMTDYVVHLHITGGESFPNMQHYTALETLTIDGDFTALPEKFMQSHKIIKSVTLNADVTEIGAYAFGSCSALESVTFSDALIRLGDSAFASCSSLTSITLPKNLTALPAYAFYNCTKLENLVWNDVLQSVGAYAVYGAKLTEIELPNTVTSIGEYSFANNSLLETFTPSNQLTTLPAYFLSNTKVTELIIPDGVTAVEANAFANFNLKTLTVGKGFQALPESFIRNHETLQTVILPETLVSIGANAFSGCTALTDLQLPQSLVEIGANAFSGCTALTEISLPASLSTIGESAFSGASRLNSVTIPSLESWLSLTLANGASSPACNKATLFLSGEPITELVIPETVTEIPNYAFCNVVGLTNVDLANVTKIGAHAFSGAEITEIDLKNVKTLENYAFSNSALSTVNFRNVETIGASAFYNTKLTEARLPNSLTSLGTSAFAYCKDLTVFDTGDGLTKIEDDVIEKNYNLANVTYQPFTSIRLGENVNTLSFHALEGIKTKTFYFDATSCGKYDTYSVSFNSATIENLIFGENVRSVGYYLFYTEAVHSSVSWVSPTITSIEFKGESIDSIGKYAFANVKGLKSLTLPIVQSLDSYAFDNCKQIETLVAHSDGISIGINAHATLKSATVYGDLPADIFNGYTNLSSVTLYDTKTIGQNAFYNCTSLTELTIPDSVTSIGEMAFSNASALQSLRLPSGITEIREKTFYGCSALTDLTIPDGVTFIGSSAFDQSGLTTVNIPNSLEKAFDDSFTGLSIPTKTENGVKYYGNEDNPYLILVSAKTWSTSFETKPETRIILSTALADNETVKSVVLSENVTYINGGAFNREYVTAIVVEKGNLKYEVRDKILYDLSPLEIVFAPKNLSGNITVYAYCDLLLQNCPNLTGVTFAETVTYVHPYALNGSKENITHLAVKNPSASLAAVQNVRILSGMGKLEYLEMPLSDSLGEYFGVNAFDGAVAVKQTYGFVTSGFTTSLTSKTYYIPANLKTVVVTKSYGLGSYGRPSSSGAYSYWGYFENCTMLQEVTVRGVEEIARQAFFKCSNLTKVTLGEDVKKICFTAFESCRNIQSIYLEGGQAQRNSLYVENDYDSFITNRLTW